MWKELKWVDTNWWIIGTEWRWSRRRRNGWRWGWSWSSQDGRRREGNWRGARCYGWCSKGCLSWYCTVTDWCRLYCWCTEHLEELMEHGFLIVDFAYCNIFTWQLDDFQYRYLSYVLLPLTTAVSFFCSRLALKRRKCRMSSVSFTSDGFEFTPRIRLASLIRFCIAFCNNI